VAQNPAGLTLGTIFKKPAGRSRWSWKCLRGHSDALWRPVFA